MVRGLPPGPPKSSTKYRLRWLGATARPKRSPAPPLLSIVTCATWAPPGLVSTMLPSSAVRREDVAVRCERHPERAVQRHALGTVTPAAREAGEEADRRVGDRGDPVIGVSATYSVPSRPSATPVGPITSAFGSVRSGNPVAITSSSNDDSAGRFPVSSAAGSAPPCRWLTIVAPELREVRRQPRRCR